jgi:pectate lyase
MSVRLRRMAMLGGITASACLTAGLFAAPVTAAPGCRVDYAIASQWNGGFGANITVTNVGDPLSSWQLRWSFSAGQSVTQGWNATFSQSGAAVTASNASYNGPLATGASTAIGFNGSWSGSNPVPSSFTLNGVTCTGGVVPSATPSTNPTPTPTLTPTPTPTTSSSTPPVNPTGLVGWATQGGGTSGGGNAGATTLTSSSALTSAMAGTNAAVIRVSGTISCSGMLRVGSNKTIIGNSGATIAGCGLNVSESSNVIIRNLTFRDWNDDAINVQYSTRVWIDHNTLSNGADGAIDVKRASDFVTVSWNRIFGHDKSMLLGHSDDNGAEDRGHLRVTYHHNYFDGTNQRHPRVRFGNPVHVYNNFYRSVGGYGVASTEGAGVLVEGNYFENTDDPFHLGEADSGPGTLVARNNVFSGSGTGQQGGSVASIPYSYSMDPAANVKSIVTSGAGAGRISL